MKTRFLFIALPFLISQSAFALNDKPEVCPSIAAIQAVSVNQVVHYPDRWEALGPKNRYNTKDEWQFVMAFRPDIKKKDALLKAKELLTGLFPLNEPQKDDKGWHCIYVANIDEERGFGIARVLPDETNFSRQWLHLSTN